MPCQRRGHPPLPGQQLSVLLGAVKIQFELLGVRGSINPWLNEAACNVRVLVRLKTTR